MEDIAIVFATTSSYLNQALAMYEQLRKFGVEELAWVVPLEKLDNSSEQLLKANFRERVTKVLELPENIKPSGNKPFLPRMIPKHKYYILMDTDLIILRKNFFDNFLNQTDHKVTLVSETFTCSDFIKNKPWQKARFSRFNYFPEILNQPYLQTGTIGICETIYDDVFNLFVKFLKKIPVRTGDLQVWNYMAWQYPQLFRLTSPQHCLVLRPTGKGFSSTFHLPYVTYDREQVKYKGHAVDALHYTASQGNVVTMKEYANLIKA